MLVVISFVTVCSLAFSRTFAKPQNRSSPSPSLFQDPVTVTFCLGEESARWKKRGGERVHLPMAVENVPLVETPGSNFIGIQLEAWRGFYPTYLCPAAQAPRNEIP